MVGTAIKKLNVEYIFHTMLNDKYNQTMLDDTKTIHIFTVARGRLGNDVKFQATAEFFEVPYEDLDPTDDWGVVEDAADKVAEELNRMAYERGYEGKFYFTHNDIDGDFDLFYTIEGVEK